VHLVKQPRYYSATDEVRESYDRFRPGGVPNGTADIAAARLSVNVDYGGERPEQNPLGKLPGSVWTIPSEPLRLPDHLGVQHYAAFPSEWPRRLILGWSPPGICLECGQGRVPVVEREYQPTQGVTTRSRGLMEAKDREEGGLRAGTGLVVGNTTATILGYTCSCTPFTDHPGSGERGGGSWGQVGSSPLLADGSGYVRLPNTNGRGETSLQNKPRSGPWREYHLDGWKAPPTRPAIVADVFGGTGTTAMVARALGRIGVSVDLSHSYSRAARWRVHHDAGKAISRTWVERQGQLL
jgi:hypothetical protein